MGARHVAGKQAIQSAKAHRQPIVRAPLQRGGGQAFRLFGLELILPALAGALGSEYFLASEVIASANPALVLMLAGMNARRLGKLLRRGDGVPVAGYVVHARGRETGAVLWEVLRVL